MNKVIEDPDIPLAPEATHSAASFDGKPWDRPHPPYLTSNVLVTFFEGAAETWKRFSAEFQPGGVIDSAPAELRRQAWMPTTKYANEGAIGSSRVAMRRYHEISQHQLNARTCYRRNRTSCYIEAILNKQDRAHLRKQACKIDAQTLEKNRRRQQAAYDKGLVEKKRSQDMVKQQKKDAAAAKLAAVIPVLEVGQLTSAHFTNADLDMQLEWHRQFSNDIPRKKNILTKALKLQALRHAVTGFLSRKNPRESLESVDETWEAEADGGSDEE